MNPNARAQREAVWGEWRAPLVAQITGQAERIGCLEDERDELRRRAEAAEGERDALRLRLAAVSVPPVVVVAGQEAPEAPPATIPTLMTTQGLWARLRRALGRT